MKRSMNLVLVPSRLRCTLFAGAWLLAGCPSARSPDAPQAHEAPPTTEAQEPAQASAQPAPPAEERPSSGISVEVLDAQRASLADASSWEELDAQLADLRRLLRDAHDLPVTDRFRLQSAIASEAARWAKGRSDRQGLGRGEACVANSQCADGVCAGPGCVPGRWTCRVPVQPDEPITTDMRTVCLCSGMTYQGSSSHISTFRVYEVRGACPEGLGRPRLRP